MSNKLCTTCNHNAVKLFKNCAECRTQWKAFYSGATQVSPLMRAITVEESERVASARTR